MKNTQRGFTLLVAIIFMSVMLSFGLALASLAYKQQVLASGAIESQYAFYAADAGLECALYADQQLNSFDYASHDVNNPPNVITCDNVPATQLPGSYSYDSNRLTVVEYFTLDSNTPHPRCVYVTIYKYSAPQPPNNMTTYLFSQGYDVPCGTVTNPNGARFVSRGISAYH